MLHRVLFFLLVCIGGCVKPLEVPGPAFSKKAVLNGTVRLNTYLSITLHYNLKIDVVDSLYPAIDNATVNFYENDKLIGKATYSNEGKYILNYVPEQGYTYKVVADIPDYGRLEASEWMPITPEFGVNISERKDYNPNRNPDLIAQISSITPKTLCWLSVYQTTYTIKPTPREICSNRPPGPLPPECQVVYILRPETNFFATNSGLIDRFNGFYDSVNGTYVYKQFMRIDNTLKQGDNVELLFTLSNPTPKNSEKGEALYIRMLTVGPTYDQYLKSALASSFNQPADAYGDVNNPFAEPIPVFSNVKNGIGIFGALIEQEFKFPAIKNQ